MQLTLDSFSSAAAALVLVLGLALVAGRAVRSFGFARHPSGIRGRRLGLQDTLVLDRARRLHIVRCDGRDLVLLTGGTADLAVGWLAETSDVVGGAGS